MRIGVDIDGVTSDSYTVWLRELNQYFNKNISILEDYDIHLVYDVSWDEMNDFFKQNMEHLFMLPQPMKGAKQGIESLIAQGHEIIYVTARSADEEEVTLRWMDKYKIPYDNVVFSDFKSKVDLARQWQLELFIEDYMKNAEAISESGIPVLLLNASYNQGEMTKGIKRCRDWMEIVNVLNRI
ncbi:5' nucleotidase, NT5C type [Desulfitobacterium metallireducens]|uniref:Nucleotidase n=1 Tax=Desulfitobacterium metallireducens DSM 15288 TaxID=871968 RepID=W0E517_9FIRM|nr:hypothetical protein [Desulfitobacterium metallireducens]AHF05960.1 hypothetical protein DESME_01850 [Desulfitobacterium metallireducens DSM 15288]